MTGKKKWRDAVPYYICGGRKDFIGVNPLGVRSHRDCYRAMPKEFLEWYIEKEKR